MKFDLVEQFQDLMIGQQLGISMILISLMHKFRIYQPSLQNFWMTHNQKSFNSLNPLNIFHANPTYGDQAKKWEKIDQQLQQLATEEAHSVKQSVQQSESSRIYEQILSEARSYRQVNQIISILRENGIFYNQNYIQQSNNKTSQCSLRFNHIKHTKYFQIIAISATLGPFTQNITVYNTLQYSNFSWNQDKCHQQKTFISLFSYEDKDYVLKQTKFRISQKQQFIVKRNNFVETLNECFIGKILSALKIGPKLANQFGFDIFVSENSCFFIMEFCQNLYNKQFTEQDGEILKQNLRELHSISIVHRDIKPDNIMYSPSYQKYVFIDFGVSQSVIQKPNQLIYTSFSGTYRYSSDEMKRLFQNHTSGYVNVHLNDAHGLQISIKQMKRKFTYVNFDQNIQKQSKQSKFQQFLTEIKIKHSLYKKNANLAYEMMQTINFISEEMCASLMNFLYEIPLNQDIRQFYKEFLEQKVCCENKFKDLKEILANTIYYEHYRGKRQFFLYEEQQIFQNTQQFYQEILYHQCKKNKEKKPSIKTLQNYLFTTREYENQSSKYDLFVIDYLNLKRMNNVIPIEKKVEVCKKYLKNSEINESQKTKTSDIEYLFQLVFHNILLAMKVQTKIQRFSSYLRALQNYFMISENIDVRILSAFQQVVQKINECQFVSISQKIEDMLLLLLSISSIGLRSLKVKVYEKMNEISEIIQQNIMIQVEKSKKEKSIDRQKCQIYQICMKFFQFQCNVPKTQKNCNENELLQKLNTIKPNSSSSSILLNYIQYRLLQRIYDAENLFIKRKQMEEIIIQEMQDNNEFTPILPKLITQYFHSNQVKILRNLLHIFDTSVQIQSIKDASFPFIRILILAYERRSVQDYSSSQGLIKIPGGLQQFLEVSVQKLVIFLLRAQNFCSSILPLINRSEPLPKICFQIDHIIKLNLPKSIKIYQQRKPKIFFGGSLNMLYLQLLYLDFQLIPEKYSFLHHPEQDKSSSKTKSFQKLVNMDRSNLNKYDHIFLLYTDLLWIHIKNKSTANRDSLQYFSSKIHMIDEMFTIQNTREKCHILLFFCYTLMFMNNSNDTNLIREAINLIHPIISKNYCFQLLSYGVSKPYICSLIRLKQFKQLISEVYRLSKYFTNHSSNYTLKILTQLYHAILNLIDSQKIYQQLFFIQLKYSLKNLDLKKAPIFCVFLLFCTRRFNRMAILKKIIKHVAEFKYETKYLIFSRLNKQLLKVNSQSLATKRKVLLRMEARYPSKDGKSLEDLYGQLNVRGNFNEFNKIFKQKIQEKIIKMGELCKIYEQKKTQWSHKKGYKLRKYQENNHLHYADNPKLENQNWDEQDW